jgi:hypothetical protein
MADSANVKRLTYDDIKVGDLIEISKGRAGYVKWKGEVEFKTKSGNKNSLGLELVGSVGKNDGSWLGKRYFTCAKDRGMIVQMDRVRKRLPHPDKKKNGLGNSSKDLSKIGLSKKTLGIKDEPKQEEVLEHEFDGWGSWDGEDISKYINGRLLDHGSLFLDFSADQLVELRGSKDKCRQFFTDHDKNPKFGKTLYRYLNSDLTEERKADKD